jgi:hypothetical protein
MTTPDSLPIPRQTGAVVIDARRRFADRNFGNGCRVKHAHYGEGEVVDAIGWRRIVDFEEQVTKYPCELTHEEQAAIGCGAELEFIRVFQIRTVEVFIDELRLAPAANGQKFNPVDTQPPLWQDLVT